MASREFETGAIRDTAEGKLDFEGFLSPFALERFAQYMHAARTMPDGSFRDSDNWQLGIPEEQYLKSLLRHVISIWKAYRADPENVPEDELCAAFFNIQGLLHERVTRPSAA